MITRTSSHTTPVPDSDFLIFGVSADYAEEHSERLRALATGFGAAFVGNCFCVHRDVAALHPDYAGEVLSEIGNHGLLP